MVLAAAICTSMAKTVLLAVKPLPSDEDIKPALERIDRNARFISDVGPIKKDQVMGAITFSLDTRLVAALQSKIPLRVFVETGTFQGDTVAALTSCFDKVFSIEASPMLWTEAAKRFAADPRVQLLQGNSPEKLRELHSELQGLGTLYWLDAHWCVAADTSREPSQCPLLEELQAIGKLNNASVVLIDDARLFLAPPPAPHEISQWPGFHQIVSRLLSMSSTHTLMVVNDVIAFFPEQAGAAVRSYARSYGTDWLAAANGLRDQDDLMRQLRLCSLRSLALIARTGKRCLKTLCPRILRPRLGQLNQYAPRPLVTSAAGAGVFPGTPTPKLKFSIVTPSFQQGSYIERTLRSVLEQGYPDLEYFIQDGGSTDGTMAVLEKYKDKLSGWMSEKDSGQAQAINRGFAKTSGEIMAWLNSDDLLLPGALAVVADYFNRHPEVDVVYGNRLLIDVSDMVIGRWILPGHDGNVLSWQDYVPQETLFWRRRAWDMVDARIDESFSFAMDWDLLVRFRDAQARFGHIPRFLGAFRIHAAQKTSALMDEVGHKEMARIRGRLLGRLPSPEEIRNATLPFLLKHVVADMAYGIKKWIGLAKQ